MTRLPRIPGKVAVRALEKGGFIIKRQSGSHVIMADPRNLSRRCVIPVHSSKDIKPGTLHSILRGTQLSVDEFIKLLK